MYLLQKPAIRLVAAGLLALLAETAPGQPGQAADSVGAVSVARTAADAVTVDAAELKKGAIALDGPWFFQPAEPLDPGPPSPVGWQPLDSTAVAPGETLPGGAIGGFFRIDLELAPELVGEVVALRLWHPGASEIYFDSKSIGGFGRLPAVGRSEQPYDPLGVPLMLAPERAGRHRLLIRYSCTAAGDPLFGRWLLGRRGAGFEATLDQPRRALAEVLDRRTVLLGLNLGVSGLATGFAVFHFLLFALHPRHRGNLWFSLFALGLAANGSLEILLRGGHVGLWGGALASSGNLLAAGTILVSAIGFLGTLRPTGGRRTLHLFTAAWTLLFLAHFVPTWRPAISAIGGFLILLSGGAVLFLAAGAWRSEVRVRHLGSLGLSALGWSVVAATEGAKHAGWLELGPEAAGFATGFLLVLLGASLFLARRVADEGRELESLTRSLEERVEERTAELRRSEDAAQAASRAKSTFLATMSHEIRTPMNAIVGFSELLTRTSLPADAGRKVATMHRSARSLLVLLDEVLDLSRIEADELVVEKRPFELEGLLADTVDLFATQAAEAKLGLDWRIREAPPGPLLGDPARLRQILVNLLGNALKFTPRGRVELEASWRDGRLRLEVQDTGIGIAAEDQDRLFDPFFQVDDTATRRHGGAGLGLAISSRLAEAMHGSLAVESEPGRGSRFTLELPLPAGDPIEGEEPAPAGWSPPSGSLRILLAEDNEVNQIVTESMLRELGQSADLAENGRAALELLARQRYDVVLLDLHMPDMGGLEVARRLRENGEDVFLVALTASVQAEDRQRCHDVGMDAFLAKPVGLDELRRVLGRARAGSSERLAEL